jgi:tRNA A37 threonylcarbamoyladenosine dehydratase
VDERFTRTIDLYGADGFARIRAGGVIVAGLGGVGAHCAVSLARSGVGRLLLVDFDRVSTASLNRHPVAGPADVGRFKTDVLGEWAREVCPDTEVEALAEFLAPETLESLLPPLLRESYPVLVDAIDGLNCKISLLLHGLAHEWITLSSMGAAAKCDPGQVRVADIEATRVCPLARQVRIRLRRRGVRGGVTCVYSEESPAASLEPDPEDIDPDRRGRIRRRQPSNMSLPGIFGYALAAVALGKLARE